ASAVTVLANDTDVDAGPKSVASVTQPANGTVAVTGGGTGLSYAPNADSCNSSPGGAPDTFTYTLTPGVSTATVSMTVTCVDDAPELDLDGAQPGTGSSATFDESVPHTGAGVLLVDPSATLTDIDDTDIESATATLAARPDGDASESLSADAGASPITVEYTQATGTLSLTGTATRAQYLAVLETVRYDNTKAQPSAAGRTIDFAVNDGDADSNTATAAVTVVPANAAPQLDLDGGAGGIDDAVAFTEDAGAVALAPGALASDADNANLAAATITLTNRPDGAAESLAADVAGTAITATAYDPATGVLQLTGSDTKAQYQSVLRTVAYDNTSNTPDTTNRTIAWTVSDGSLDSPVADTTLSVTSANDLPALDLNAGAAGVDEVAAYLEDQPPTTLAPDAIAADPDNANLQSATVTLTNHPDGGAESLSVDTAGTSITPVAYDSTTGVLSLSGSDTVAHYQQVLRTIAYVNAGQNATTTNRTVNFVVNDGSGNSNSPVVSVTVMVINDPPVVDMNAGGGGIDSDAAFVEDSSPTVVGSGPVNLGASATVSDTDNATLSSATLAVTNHPDGVNESLSVTIPGGSPITTGGYNPSTGVLQLTGNGATAVQLQTVMRSARYNNASNTPDPTNRDVTIKVNDGALDSTVAHSTVSVTPTNDAPVADDETFNATNSAVANTTLVVNQSADGAPPTPDPTDTSPGTDRPHKTISGDIIAGDTDPENATLTVQPGTFATNDGGSVTLQADGDFTFEPAASTSCTDTSDFFDYTIQDNASPNGTDQGRVAIAIAGCVYYVDNNDAQGNQGTSEKPFDTLAQAQAASGTGNSIYVYRGDGTTAGQTAGIDLKLNQKLIGEAGTLTIGSDTLNSADPAKRPAITTTAANVVNLAAGNTLQGLRLDPRGGGGISGGAGDASGTIDDVQVIDSGTAGTAPGLDLNGTSGTYNVSNLTVDNAAASAPTSADIGVRLNNAGTVNFASAGTISITTNGAKGLDATGTAMGAGSVFDDITVTGSGTGAVSLSGTTGTTTLGDGSGTDLDLTTTSGATAALSIANAGTISVPLSGTANLNATGGPALTVTATTNPSLPLDAVSSTNSASQAINLVGLTTGTFSATSGTLTGYAGTAFVLNGGSGAISYPGIFNNGAGNTADISNRSGGVVSLTGNINDSSDAGGGISSSGSTGGSVIFTGVNKTLNTGAGDAMTVAFPNASTANFVSAGGGLDIDTTTGKGYEAVGVDGNDGNVQISASGNTIDSTAGGRAVNISNANMMSTGVTLQRASSSGATNGVRLSNTGASGAFAVTGTSIAPSGGTIANSTGPGISLTNVGAGASFDGVNVTGGNDDGVNADTVNGINFTDSTLTNNGDSHAGGTEDRAFDLLNVTGTDTILRTTASGANDSNAHIRNTSSGTATWTVDQSTFSDAKFNAGLRFRGEGSSTLTANVTNSTFSLNADPGFSMQTDSSNTAHQTVLFNNNNVSGGSSNAVSGRPQVSINTDSASVGKVTISNNHIKSAAGAEIIVNTLANQTAGGSLDAKVINNTINDAQPGTLDALSDSGTSIWGWAHGDGAMRMEVTNNTVQNWGNRALELSDNDGTGTADYTVTGNTFSTPDVTANQFEGMYAFAGGVAADSANVCVDMRSNDFDGIGQNGVSDLALDRFTNGGGSSQLRFAGNNTTTTTGLQAQLRSVNPLSPALTVETFSFGPTATAATSCTLTSGTP
ncbi:MAG: hypothetical protein QOE11_546, partial [Solirubrobacteraceae bacterium]|nr:hypothetical protein [Solirubrobacteraceae bacterium]